MEINSKERKLELLLDLISLVHLPFHRLDYYQGSHWTCSRQWWTKSQSQSQKVSLFWLTIVDIMVVGCILYQPYMCTFINSSRFSLSYRGCSMTFTEMCSLYCLLHMQNTTSTTRHGNLQNLLAVTKPLSLSITEPGVADSCIHCKWQLKVLALECLIDEANVEVEMFGWGCSKHGKILCICWLVYIEACPNLQVRKSVEELVVGLRWFWFHLKVLVGVDTRYEWCAPSLGNHLPCFLLTRN